MCSNTDDEKIILKKLISRVIKEIEEEGGKLNENSSSFNCLIDRVKKDAVDSKNTVELLLKYITFNSSFTRQCALSVIDFFYMKSKRFRGEINLNLTSILLYTAEIDPISHPLPKPKEEADQLKIACIQYFKKWEEKFTNQDARFTMAIRRLKDTRSLDYERVSADMEAEGERRRKNEEKKKRLAKLASDKVWNEFSRQESQMKTNIEEAKTLLNILVPSFIDEDIPSTSTSITDYQTHGYFHGESFTVEIKNPIPKITTDDTNIDIVQSAIDSQKILTSHIKKIDKWLKTLHGHSTASVISILVELKNKIKIERDKLSELNLYLPRGDDSSDDDDDFIDVPDTYEPKSDGIEEPIAGCSKWSDEKTDINSSSSSIKTVGFGLDLKYWGQKTTVAQIPMNNSDCHRFWRPSDDSEERTDRKEAYETRVFTYIGEDIRGDKKCNARFKNGSLCPRMDVEICPIHGKIIDRDEEGFPMEEQKEEDARKRIRRDKEEDDYMDDLEEQLGIDLRGKKKNKNKKKEDEHSGRAVRERLQTKLLNPRTVKRVSAVLDEVRKAKIQKKFGDQISHRYL